MSASEALEEGLEVGGIASSITEEERKSLARIKVRYSKIVGQLDENPTRLTEDERADLELEKIRLTEQSSSIVSPQGTPRSSTTPEDTRASGSIRYAVREALAEIQKHAPDVAQLLSKNVKKGARSLAYHHQPGDPAWSVK